VRREHDRAHAYENRGGEQRDLDGVASRIVDGCHGVAPHCAADRVQMFRGGADDGNDYEADERLRQGD
jgi:hypothetical protein